MPAIFIILAVGIIVGSWMYSGTVPALIYYGLKFLNPSYLLVSAFIISAMTSIATGTAWGSASTAGIALISIANQLVCQQVWLLVPCAGAVLVIKCLHYLILQIWQLL